MTHNYFTLYCDDPVCVISVPLVSMRGYHLYNPLMVGRTSHIMNTWYCILNIVYVIMCPLCIKIPSLKPIISKKGSLWGLKTVYSAVEQRTLSALRQSCTTAEMPSLIPRPPHPALSLAVWKAGGRPGWIYHVMHAALTSHSVCSYLGSLPFTHSSFYEFYSFFLFSLSCEFDCYWIDRG